MMTQNLPKRGSRTAKHMQAYINHDKRDTMTPMSPFLGAKEGPQPKVNGVRVSMPKPILRPEKG